MGHFAIKGPEAASRAAVRPRHVGAARGAGAIATAIAMAGWAWVALAFGQATHPGPPTVEQGRRTLWSVQPVKNPPVPQIRDKSWPRGPIDNFILAKLEQ